MISHGYLGGRLGIRAGDLGLRIEDFGGDLGLNIEDYGLEVKHREWEASESRFI